MHTHTHAATTRPRRRRRRTGAGAGPPTWSRRSAGCPASGCSGWGWGSRPGTSLHKGPCTGGWVVRACVL